MSPRPRARRLPRLPTPGTTTSGQRREVTQAKCLKKSCCGLRFTQAEWSPEWSHEDEERIYKSLRADPKYSLTLLTPISSEVNKTYGSQPPFHAIAALPNSTRDPLRQRLDS